MKTFLSIVLLGFIAATYGYPAAPRFPHRIVGGELARPNEFPFLLTIRFLGSHYCGGIILDANTGITAAHCTKAGLPLLYTVFAGKHRQYAEDVGQQNRTITRFIAHEGYNEQLLTNDIALFKVNAPFELNDIVQKINLPPPNHTARGFGVAAGWGLISENGIPADYLRRVTLPFVSDDECRTAYAPIGNHVDETMVCAGDIVNGGKDACNGDSGGPLLGYDLEDVYLVGLVSWGLGCARPNYPGVYTEVTWFLDWINRNK